MTIFGAWDERAGPWSSVLQLWLTRNVCRTRHKSNKFDLSVILPFPWEDIMVHLVKKKRYASIPITNQSHRIDYAYTYYLTSFPVVVEIQRQFATTALVWFLLHWARPQKPSIRSLLLWKTLRLRSPRTRLTARNHRFARKGRHWCSLKTSSRNAPHVGNKGWCRTCTCYSENDSAVFSVFQARFMYLIFLSLL